MQDAVQWSIRPVVGVALAAFAVFGVGAVTPAAAASCKTWAASMTEDEGGPAMTATVCTDGTYGSPTLVLQCSGKPWLRYDLGEKASDNLEPGISAQFSFTAGTAPITRKLDLEAMDNMFAIELAPADPLLAMLQSGHDVSIADTAGKYAANTFSLNGSRTAIAKVLASCNAPAAQSGDDD